MSAWLSQFHFLRPWWLALALLWLVLIIWRLRASRSGTTLSRLADAALLPYLLEGAGKGRGYRWLLAGLAAVLVTLALAGPTWQRLPQPLYGDGAAQVVVASLSPRMLARDVQPNRMQRVRFKVHDLLHANAAGRNGLVAYAGAAFTVAPLTNDAHALDDLVDALAPDIMPVPGDAPAKGIRRGVRLLEQGGASGGSLVLVTDQVDAAAIAAARQAHAKGISVSVLGVGTQNGAPVRLANGHLLSDAAGNIVIARSDPASLRALADAGGGVYVPMRADDSDITVLAEQLHASHREPTAAPVQGDQWRDMGPWLLLPLALLAALAFRRGWLLLLPLVLLPGMTRPALAAGVAPAAAASTAVSAPSAAPPSSWPQRWAALWRNADQRAQRALAHGHAQRAQALAHSPAVRGAAAYRAGDYAAAATAFARAHGAEAAYNRGNALARQGLYQQAIKAYDDALKLDPKFADARANRKAVREWLQRHKPPHQSGKNGQSGTRQSGKSGRSGKSEQSGKSGQSGSRSGQKHGQGQAASPSGQDGGSQRPAQASSSPAHASSRPSPARPTSSPSPARAASTPSQGPAPASSGARRGKPATHERAPDARTARRQQAEARRASQALRRQMQQQTGKPEASAQPFELGRAPAHASSVDRLPTSMQHALERVPDDPGGLLRRKFQLEYEQRQNGRDGERR